jgi:hypothetical protein
LWLVLELQLLAAGQVQRQRQHPEAVGDADADWQRDWLTQVLFWSNVLLQHQTRAILQAGSSCLPPEVLEHAGLQLLQALAAPVQQLQQLQLSSASSADSFLQHLLLTEQGSQEQLYILRAAASGMEPADDLCECSRDWQGVGPHARWLLRDVQCVFSSSTHLILLVHSACQSSCLACSTAVCCVFELRADQHSNNPPHTLPSELSLLAGRYVWCMQGRQLGDCR